MSNASNLPVEVSYSTPGDLFQVRVPPEAVARLLEPYQGRRRAFLVRLLNGYSKRMAAAAVGISVRSTQLWAKNDAGFAEAVQACEDAGFGEVIEAELYRRALAGPSDRGSMRALELVLKSRAPEFREKFHADIELHLQFERAMERAIGGWRERVENAG